MPTHATAWMDLEDVVLSEISQTQENWNRILTLLNVAALFPSPRKEKFQTFLLLQFSDACKVRSDNYLNCFKIEESYVYRDV